MQKNRKIYEKNPWIFTGLYEIESAHIKQARRKS